MYFDPSYKVHCSVDATDNDKCFEWVSDRGEIAAGPFVRASAAFLRSKLKKERGVAG
jgi:hypothetical protein